MYKLTDKSSEIISYIFEHNFIFHINSFPITAALQDGGCLENKIASLSGQWLYDRHGFFSSFEDYNTFHKRLTEFTYHGDYLKTLRQRMNIVHEMIDCKMNTDLPVHISVKNKKNKKLTLDLENKKSLENFSIIAHPGQTRLQSSLFLRDPLKNTIFYISKKNMKTIDFKYYDYITPILTVDQLISYYKPTSYTIDSRTTEGIKEPIIYDFNMPKFEKGMKSHEQHDTYILKANNIKHGTLLEAQTNLHSSTYYLPNTFISMNNFCKIFFNNSFNIYTDNEVTKKKHIQEGERKILDEIFSLPNVKKVTRTLLSDNFSLETSSNYNDTARSNYHYLKSNFTNEEIVYMRSFLKMFSLSKNPDYTGFDFKVIKSSNINDTKKIVKLNNNKGICIIFKSNIKTFERNIFELLFCIPSSYTISKNKDSSICIINCEHEYWKSGKNYKEYILTDNFFKT